MEIFWVISIVIALLIGSILFLWAKEKGKNPQKAFAIGAIVTLLIAYGISLIKNRKKI